VRAPNCCTGIVTLAIGRSAGRLSRTVGIRPSGERADADDDKHSGPPKTVRSTLSTPGLSERTTIDVKPFRRVQHNHTDAAHERPAGCWRFKSRREADGDFRFFGALPATRNAGEVDAKAPKLI